MEYREYQVFAELKCLVWIPAFPQGVADPTKRDAGMTDVSIFFLIILERCAYTCIYGRKDSFPAIFILSYILFVILQKKRSLVAFIGAILLVLSQTLSPKEAFLAINWNVMGIFVGTLAVADVFMESLESRHIWLS